MSGDDSSSAGALASRRNGARSRGPTTAAGKARVAKNALKHGLSAGRMVLLDDDDPAAFAALARTVQTELAPADLVIATARSLATPPRATSVRSRACLTDGFEAEGGLLLGEELRCPRADR